MPPALLFGTATFGMSPPHLSTPSSLTPLLTTLPSLGIHRLDTAPRYPPLDPGRSEQLIGETAEVSKGFVVDTKVYTDTGTDGGGDLGWEAMEGSVTGSLGRLGRERVYPTTPLEEQVRNFNEQIKRGRCKAWGVSNVPPAMLEEMLRICEEKGLQKPSCYQGDYNLITRGMETKLLPILRAHGIAFIGFRPLAAGFLTGKASTGQVEGTRFDASNPLGPIMNKNFGASELHAGMKKFDDAVRKRGLSPAEVATRWLAHHSALGDGDGIILGASRVEQVVETMGWIGKGPLEEELMSVAEDLWEDVKGVRVEVI
ncbi:aflatoxin B1 aldehyde reductase-like protein [Lentithecium fluviatile CBS 122367]|uniref:Aflatoxin B1 aldehyde reductase-like protein n=1 Tax=Lentithecium fluviatile CBS 122367 TaxID=1168545 RepID=A0A6G1J7S1_9PLEO|nr:aflatoxin B1 aldehyde reductase-like protein [Lentithecium fluviatile CBS 122367]